MAVTDLQYTWNTQASLISELKNRLEMQREMLELYQDINAQLRQLLEMKNNPVYIVGEKS